MVTCTNLYIPLMKVDLHFLYHFTKESAKILLTT